MKAGIYYGAGDVRIEEVPRPEPGAGELTVRVRTCGLCGTDIAKYVHRLVQPPVVLGHEVAGDVAAVGQGVTRFKIGERVIVPHHIPCFVCDYCRHGHHTMCQSFRPTNISPGGFAEYLKVGPDSVSKGMLAIPEGLSYDEASFVEPVAACLRGILRCNMQPGDAVAIIGAGPAGLIQLQLARALGAGQAFSLDIVESRLGVALDMGASATINVEKENAEAKIKELTQGKGADVAIVAVGRPQAIEQAIKLVRKGGTVNFFAECPPGSLISFDPNLMYHSEVSFIGSYSSTPIEIGMSLELIRNRRIDVASMITHRMPLLELGRAFELATGRHNVLKILIHP